VRHHARRDGTAFSSRTAIGGGLPIKVSGLGNLVLTWYHTKVPPKIRELIRDLEAAGFKSRGGRGSHRNFKHPSGIRITISGSPGGDAKPYQEKAVRLAIELVSE
jgi:predicted RNA binding protein YcfA (HicA-like mRNA interferase family)